MVFLFIFTHFRWLHPMIEITFNATRLCKLQNCTANATIKPPMNINIASFMYIIQVLSVSYNWTKRKQKQIEYKSLGNLTEINKINKLKFIERKKWIKKFAFVNHFLPECPALEIEQLVTLMWPLQWKEIHLFIYLFFPFSCVCLLWLSVPITIMAVKKLGFETNLNWS